MKYTKKLAKEILTANADMTNYFDGSITQQQFETMLRYRMGFGEAETSVITMALILAGAKFAEN